MAKKKGKTPEIPEVEELSDVIEGEAEEIAAEKPADDPLDDAADSPEGAGNEPMHAAGLTGGWQDPVDTPADQETSEEVFDEGVQEDPASGRTGWYVAAALAFMIAGAGVFAYASPWLARNLPEGLAGYFQPVDAETGSRISALESTVGNLESATESIRNSIDSGDAAAGNSASEQTAALNQRIAGLEDQLAKLSRPPAEGGQIAAQLAALEVAVARNAEAAQAVDISPVTERLGQIEAALRAASESGGGSAAAMASVAADVAALGAQLKDLEARLAAATEDASQAALTLAAGKLAMAEQEIAILSGRLTALERDGSGKAAARAIALASLSGAVGRGNFSAELEAFKVLSPSAMATPALDRLAAAGLPPIAGLQAGFRAALQAALKAETAPGDNASWIDRMIGNTANLVTVRPVGEVAGNATSAILARAEVRVQNGDIAAALAELDALSGPARDAMAGWTGIAGARLAALAELEELKQSSLAAISGVTN